MQTVQFALFSDESIAMHARYLATQRVLRGLCCIFQTLQAKRTLLINIHIERVLATLI